MAEWELSKENIQPLKHGRKIATLNNVLQGRDEDTQKVLHDERAVFETEIRSYNGADPLDPWYRYISWVEQSYPRGGKEGNIHILLENCIKLFKDDQDARNDVRFLEVWLKYAAMSDKPLEVYSFMYKNGICTQQAGLYDAWAWHLELQNSFKNAEAVYRRGLDALTDKESKAGLNGRKLLFETRICRRMKGEEISAEEIEEQEQRSALGRLKAHGKHGKVGSVRVGSAKLGGPGNIASGPTKQPLKPNNGKGFKIFSDENGPASHGSNPALMPAPHSLPSKADYKENTMAAGKWSSAAKGPKTVNIPLDKISMHAKPAFSVHQDNEGCHSTVTPHKLVPGESNVLSARKLDRDEALVHCPVALFEPPDPTKNPMYCKNKVYQGATEFSFEELRAVSWKAKEKIRLENEEMERKRLEFSEMERKMEKMAKQMEEYQKMMMQSQQIPPQIQVVGPSVSSDSQLSNVSSTPDSSLFDNSQRKKTSDDTIGLINANPNGGRNSRASVTPSPIGRKMPSCHPSPTVNTKEALAVMEQLWSTSADNDSVFIDNPSNPSPQFVIFSDESAGRVASSKVSAPVVPFQIFSDNSDKENIPVPPFQIFSDSTDKENVPAVPFQIFSDNPENENAPAVPFQIFSDKENAPAKPVQNKRGLTFNSDKENLMSENVENCPPSGFVQPSITRTKTGVLTPAENVEWMPLEEQERLLDEDERMQEEQFGRIDPVESMPRPMLGNHTMFVPEEAEFDQMAKLSSTPFNGRSFVPFEDENTCAVQLVYRDQVVDDSLVMPPPSVNDPPQCGVPLSPIVETSREHYRSSSSSSGAETTHNSIRGEHSKSHWGNTGTSTYHRTADSTTGLGLSLGVRTPGNGLLSACGSGYIGDRSGMSSLRATKQSLINRNEPVVVTAEEFGKRMETVSVTDDDQTGMFSDMLAEFKQTLQKPEQEQKGHLECSLNPSFIEGGPRSENVDLSTCPNLSHVPVQQTRNVLSTTDQLLKSTGKIGSNYLDMTDAEPTPRLERTNVFIDAPALNLTNTSAPNPNLTNTTAPYLNLTTAQTPTLNFTNASAPTLNLTNATAPTLNLTNATAPTLNLTNATVPTLNLTNAAAPTLNYTNAQTLNLTNATVPYLNLTNASAPTLNYTNAPNHTFDDAAPSLNLTNAPVVNTSRALGNLDITAEDPAHVHHPVVEIPGLDMNHLNPFSENTQSMLLSRIAVPVDERHGYVRLEGKLPNVKPKLFINLGPDNFVVGELKGEGGFAKVYSAVREPDGLDCTIAGIDAVLKVQKPANEWEWYICTEVEQRIRATPFNKISSAIMSIPRNYSFSDGGIFVSYHQELGNLLDLINLLKGKVDSTASEAVSVYYIIEILYIVEALHSVGVVHADIKADNFLLKDVPQVKAGTTTQEVFNFSSTSLQLIDFGRAIDLAILPPNITFDQVVKTEGLKCIEMREGRRWREHIDYFGIAAIAYCMLYGSYIDVVKKKDVWEVKGNLRRWWKAADLWKQFFHEFINIKDTNKASLPSLRVWRERFMERFCQKEMYVQVQEAKKKIRDSI